MKPKGEILPFGVFGGVAFVGFLSSFGIRGEELESGGWDEEDGNRDEADEDDDTDDVDDDHEDDEANQEESREHRTR